MRQPNTPHHFPRLPPHQHPSFCVCTYVHTSYRLTFSTPPAVTCVCPSTCYPTTQARPTRWWWERISFLSSLSAHNSAFHTSTDCIMTKGIVCACETPCDCDDSTHQHRGSCGYRCRILRLQFCALATMCVHLHMAAPGGEGIGQ
jgi:hypothetical protein